MMGAGPGVMMGAQLLGSAASAGGAYYSAVGQKQALGAQATLDAINARSGASALTAQADLDTINAKSIYDFNSSRADLGAVDAKLNTDLTKTQIGMDLVGAQTAATASTAQANLDVVAGQQQALGMRTSAAVDAIKAGSSILALNVGAQISENSAHLSELQAQAALFQGQQQEQEERLQGAQQKSHATASMAARGVDLGEGSPLNVLTTSDFLTERAAEQIQQKTVMAAFAYRSQESGALLDAASKRYQAGMTAASSALETGLTEAQATSVVANVNAAADLRKALAGISLGVATKSAETKTTFADASLTRQLAGIDTDRALALAGLNSAESAAAVKKTLAAANLANGLAAANTKQTMANGINPTLAAEMSLLTSGAQVAGSWYSYGKANGKVG